jgi:hypothetical protein
MKYAVEMTSYGMMYRPSFTNIDAGIQAILKVCFRNLRGCNVDITYGRDL